MKKPNFFNQFLGQNRSVGAVTPSSRYLVKKMIAPIDFEKAKTIVEFGAGTGIITETILQKMSHDARLLVFEINQEFLEHLEGIKDKRMLLLNMSAEHLAEEMEKLSIDKVDYIVSSIPLVSIPAKIENQILSAAHNSLREGGKFIQFQYSLTSQRKLKKMFSDVEIDFTPLNFPPAFIYDCTR